MKALDPGTKAPNIELPLLGRGQFNLSQSLARGKVLLAFFKVSCPVCQYAMPFVDRIAKRTAGKGLTVVGVSQDDARSTEIFQTTYGVNFPIALDELGKYPVSNAYGLTTVPSIFLIDEAGNIEQTIVSWSKSEMEELDRTFRDSQNAKSPLFPANEQVADFRAG